MLKQLMPNTKICWGINIKTNYQKSTDKAPPIYIIFHINKCAGTTLRIGLKEQLIEGELLLLYNNENPELSKSFKNVSNYILNLSQEKKDKLKVIYGHQIYYALGKLFKNREVRFITFIRKPEKRMISQYNWQRMAYYRHGKANNFPSEGINNEKYMTFDSWLNFKNHDNFITRFLLKTLSINEEIINSNKIKKIKKMLDTFYFIGIVGNKEDLFFIQNEIGLKKFMINRNISKKYYSGNTLEQIEKQAVTLTEYDLEIYDYSILLNKTIKRKLGTYYQKRVKNIKNIYTFNNMFKAYGKHYYLYYLNNIYASVFKLSAFLKKKSITYSNLIKYIKGRNAS